MQLIVTAGLDGWVRCWDMKMMMDAEADTDTSLDFYLEPAHELRLTTAYGVSCRQSMLLDKTSGGSDSLLCDLCGELIIVSAIHLEPTTPPSRVLGDLDDTDLIPQCVTKHIAASMSREVVLYLRSGSMLGL